MSHSLPRPGASVPLAVALLAAFPALAQVEVDRPGSRPLELPQYAPAVPGRVLPDVILPDSATLDAVAAGRRFQVREIAVTGATVLGADELRALKSPYEGRELGYADLEALRLAITRAYIERGYVTSGARIPDQDVGAGVVRIEVVEGTLASVTVKSDGRLRPGSARSRLERGSSGPVNVAALERELQLLQQDPNVAKVDAVLLPGTQPGESRLEVSLTESQPVSASLAYANDENPSIGEDAGRFTAAHSNVLGFGDSLGGSYAKSEGYWSAEGSYELPLGSHGTSVAVRYSRSESEIIEPAFKPLDITSEAETWGATLRQAVYRSLGSNVAVFAGGELRESQTELLGEGFSFTPGPIDGHTELTVVRLGLDGSWRGASQVFAARLQGSVGLDAGDATRNNDPEVPDAKFTAVLAQLQWAARLPWLDAQLIARADAQVAADPLFGLEQFALGGAATVRGYVESAVVRDSGVIASLEARVPLLAGNGIVPRVELAPFVDWARGWNEEGDSRGEDERLAGAGVGLRLGWKWLSGHVYWADDLVDTAGGADALREDWHVELQARWPR